VITVAEARRILGSVGYELSNDELVARLGELSAIASEIEKAYKSQITRLPEKKD